jgi:hypothetical protein
MPVLALLADTNLAVYYNEPFWLRFLAHAAFFAGALYLAARLEADRLVKRASWRYWQLACLCLCLWNITSVNSVVLRESTDVGVVTLASGEPLRGEMREEEMRGAENRQTSFYYSLTEKADPLVEGARFAPIGAKGEIYYYLQFDTILLVLAGVFALLGLTDARRNLPAGPAPPVDEVEEVRGA